MRDGSDQLARVLLDPYSVRLVVDVFYGGERTFTNLPVTDWSLHWDLETATKSEGSLTVVYQGDGGESLTPTEFTSKLAPFGQEVNVLAEISFGDLFTETVLLGRFRIVKTPQAVDSYFGFDGRPLVSGSVVQITLGDRLTAVHRSGFRWPAIPKYSSSTWDELQYITGLPVDPSLDDKSTPGNFVYAPGDGGRLTAVQQLMSQLGGIAVTNSYGELTAVPLAPGVPVNTLTMGTRGTLLEVSTELDSATIVNEIVGTYQDDDGNPIYAWAEVASGPLAIDGPFGRATAYDTDDSITTLVAAQARLRKLLTQQLQVQTHRVTATVTWDPRTEFGDFVTLEGPRARKRDQNLSDPAWVLQGRVISLDMGSAQGGQMEAVVDVYAGLEASIRVGP